MLVNDFYPPNCCFLLEINYIHNIKFNIGQRLCGFALMSLKSQMLRYHHRWLRDKHNSCQNMEGNNGYKYSCMWNGMRRKKWRGMRHLPVGTLHQWMPSVYHCHSSHRQPRCPAFTWPQWHGNIKNKKWFSMLFACFCSINWGQGQLMKLFTSPVATRDDVLLPLPLWLSQNGWQKKTAK